MLPLRTFFFASEPTFALPLDLHVIVPLADGSERRLHTCLRLNRPHGVLLTPADAAASTILLKAALYPQRIDLSLALLHPTLVAACFSFNVKPLTGFSTHTSRSEPWFKHRPDVPNFKSHPGATVTYLRDGNTDHVGVYVRPTFLTSNIVFDLQFHCQLTVDNPRATVSTLTDEAYRTSRLTSSSFGYPPHASASAAGMAACVGYGVGLLPDSWSTTREFYIPSIPLPTPAYSHPIDTVIDGGVPIPPLRDLPQGRSLSHAAPNYGGGDAPSSSPDRGAPGYADAFAPGN